MYSQCDFFIANAAELLAMDLKQSPVDEALMVRADRERFLQVCAFTAALSRRVHPADSPQLRFLKVWSNPGDTAIVVKLPALLVNALAVSAEGHVYETDFVWDVPLLVNAMRGLGEIAHLAQVAVDHEIEMYAWLGGAQVEPVLPSA